MSESIIIPVGQALQALELLQRWATAPFPAKDAYQIGRLTARLRMNPDLMAADQARATAVRKFGVEKDGQISVPADKFQQFVDEYGPVANSTCELEMYQLPVSILEYAPPITPADMMTLEPFLEG